MEGHRIDSLESTLYPPLEQLEAFWRDAHIVTLAFGDNSYHHPNALTPNEAHELLRSLQAFVPDLARHQILQKLPPEHKRRAIEGLVLLKEEAKLQPFLRPLQSSSLPKIKARLGSVIPASALATPRPAKTRRPPVADWRSYVTRTNDTTPRVAEAYEIRDALMDIGGKDFLFLSDSHKLTTAIFEGLKESQWDMTGRKVGVLSFDHHTDMGPYDVVPNKASVMSFLAHSYANRLAVFGPTAHSVKDNGIAGTNVIYNDELYNRGVPSNVKFERHLRDILSAWKKDGITDVYTSVDLDGLRIDELGYEGVDYGRTRMVTCLLVSLLQLLNEHKLDLRASFEEVRKDMKRLETWSNILNDLEALGHVVHEPYQGVPATWIPRAMRIARDEFGMHLGLRDQQTGRRVIGDITEWIMESDKGARTIKIAAHLFNAMLREARS